MDSVFIIPFENLIIPGGGKCRAFYRKRFMRVYVPYCCLGMPYFIWKFITVQWDLPELLTFVFPVSFWIYGNAAGMWYIDAILIFYLVFPFLYRCLKTEKAKVYSFLFVLLGVIGNVLLFYLNRSYYDLVTIGISKIPLLIFGTYVGKCAYGEKKIKWNHLILISIVWFVLYMIVPDGSMGYTWLCDIRSVLGCLYLAEMLDLVKNQYISKILSFFGALTLELYLLHLFIGDVLAQYHVIQNAVVRYCMTVILSIVIACIFSVSYRKSLEKLREDGEA